MDRRAPFLFLRQKKMLCIKLQCISKKPLIKCLFAGMYLLSGDACALPRTGNCESSSHRAGEEPPSSVCKNISALLTTWYTHPSQMLLDVVGVHGQGETEAQSGSFPTLEACEHQVTHLPGQSCVPQRTGYTLISSLLLFVQWFRLIAFLLCLFKLIL